MRHPSEADLKIGDTGLNVRTVKIIIFIYTFGNARYWQNKSGIPIRAKNIGERKKQPCSFFADRSGNTKKHCVATNN